MSEARPSFLGLRPGVAIVAVLLLVLGYFAYDRIRVAPTPDLAIAEDSTDLGDQQSIAVLPSVNMSDDESNAYFSDGVSEELLNLLAQIPNLRVTSRSSSFSFRGKNVDIATVAEQLNVTHVLEGSVRKVDDRVRMTAKLIDAGTDTHIWSKSYDRKLENIFEIQEEISADIVRTLRVHLKLRLVASPQARKAANSDAHEAFLRGRYLLTSGVDDSLQQAANEFENALTHDSRVCACTRGIGDGYDIGYAQNIRFRGRHGKSSAPHKPGNGARSDACRNPSRKR